MEITYQDIILRDRVEADIDDWIRWYNVETEWVSWDAPDEVFDPVDPDEYRALELKRLREPLPEFRNFFEVATADGHHIGTVVSYAIGENWEWISWADADASGPIRWTLGIDLCERAFWGRGYGTQALIAFVRHFLNHHISPLYLQTWSGNHRMVHVAKKLGFAECNRVVGNCRAGEVNYDTLTFRLDQETFTGFLKNGR